MLELGKQICEDVRRNLFAADKEAAEKLRNNSVKLIIALVIARRQLPKEISMRPDTKQLTTDSGRL